MTTFVPEIGSHVTRRDRELRVCLKGTGRAAVSPKFRTAATMIYG